MILVRIARPLLSRRHLSTVLAACAVLVASVILAGPPSPSPSPAEQTKPAPPGAGPRIAVEPPSFDFGKALPQRALAREFNIRNFGDRDLIIENVSTSCGCTAALLDPARKVVKAGGSAPLRVTLTTAASPGSMSKSVLVRSNDPARPLFEIKLQATVVAERP
jgi:Protein of unknown function (DUF1573)